MDFDAAHLSPAGGGESAAADLGVEFLSFTGRPQGATPAIRMDAQ